MILTKLVTGSIPLNALNVISVPFNSTFQDRKVVIPNFSKLPKNDPHKYLIFFVLQNILYLSKMLLHSFLQMILSVTNVTHFGGFARSFVD